MHDCAMAHHSSAAAPSAVPTAAPLIAALPLLLLVAGCSRTDNEPGPGGVTVGEAKALDDAAAMLEARDGAEDVAAEPERAAK